MGMRGPYCNTNYTPSAPAPNPDPKRWELLEVKEFPHAFVLKVHYFDATNFEGVKVMVYEGEYISGTPTRLDPHFAEKGFSPIARFRPDERGWQLACLFAEALSNVIGMGEDPCS
jgi:hypothetical protein